MVTATRTTQIPEETVGTCSRCRRRLLPLADGLCAECWDAVAGSEENLEHWRDIGTGYLHRVHILPRRGIPRVCKGCGKPKEDARFKHCESCREKAMGLYRRRLADELCPTCGHERDVPGRKRCSACRERKYATDWQLLARLKSKGVCRYCGGQARPDLVACEDCAQIVKARKQAWRAQHRRQKQCTNCGVPVTDEKAQCVSCRVDGRAAYREAKGLGICVSCRTQDAVDGIYCTECRERTNANGRKRRAARRLQRRPRRHLSETDKLVLTLRLEGLTIREVAVELGCSKSNVHRISRAVCRRFGTDSLHTALMRAIDWGVVDKKTKERVMGDSNGFQIVSGEIPTGIYKVLEVRALGESLPMAQLVGQILEEWADQHAVLSTEDRLILLRKAQSVPNRILAQEIGCSLSSLKRKIGLLLHRMGCKSMIEGVAWGVQQGWIPFGEAEGHDSTTGDLPLTEEELTRAHE